jgi:hypothetical protein
MGGWPLSIATGTAEPDGSLELFQRDPALIEILRQALIGQRETRSDAGRREQHAPNFTDVVLRFSLARLSLIGPVLVGYLQHISFHPTYAPFDQFAQRRFGPGLRFLHSRRKLRHGALQLTGVPVHVETQPSVEFERRVGQLAECLAELPTGGEPAGGLLENQLWPAHDRPPCFLRIDSPSSSKR